MSLAELAAVVMLVGLICYALLGGADFGGGVWDLLASGPRAEEQRRLIVRAMAPVWEANHVWLILVAVLTFTCFPEAFAVASVALHVPLTLMLIGIVFRGSAFAFRQYGSTDRVVQARWGRVFAVASVVTPFLLGAAVASLTGGEIRVVNGVPVSGYVEPWLGFFPSAVGLFAVALFATLAAVYLTNETGEAGLQDDFRRRALAAQTASCVLGAACVLGAPRGAAHFEQAFLGSWWTGPLLLGTGVVVIGLFLSLARRLFRLARMLAIAQVTLVLAGWGLGQRPYLIAPDVTIAGAASPDGSLTIVLAALAVGTPLLLPSLYWLFRVFKAQRQDERPEGERPEPRPPGSEAPRRTSQCG